MQPQTDTPYDRLGGATAIRALVQRFYQIMDELPEAYGIRKLHPQDLQSSEDKLFMFLSGWLGGPPLYVEQYGHPMLRRRHFPFPIGEAERDQWLLCMKLAMDEWVQDAGLRADLYAAFAQLADHMRNKPG